MPAPAVPPESPHIMAAMRRALRDVDVGPTEAAKILTWARNELPTAYEPGQTTYLVLGSYRTPYLRRVRAVSDRLNRRYGTYAFLIGDLTDVGIPRLPGFRVKFHLTASVVGYIAAVFEQDAGGEINELGKLSETSYFEKAWVLPRGYHWTTSPNLNDERDVLMAAAQIQAGEGADEAAFVELLAEAREAGVELTIDELLSRLDDLPSEGPHYSWVHLNDFRLFELKGRCYPWATEEQLLVAVDELPGPPRPRWER